MTLLVHRGGWRATKADLAAVPVPEPTESYHPVPYGRFIEEVELHVPRFGLTVQSSVFALAREGSQMFGVLTCVNGKPAADYALAIGVRNDRASPRRNLGGAETTTMKAPIQAKDSWAERIPRRDRGDEGP